MTAILVVGGGLIGIRHVATVLAHRACTLAGLVDPDPTIKLPDGVARFADLAEVDVPVDGAIIATPTALHVDHGIQAAERGWHVLIEKPVAQNLAEADRLIAALQATGVHSLVGHHRRYHSVIDRLKTMLDGGEIGQVVTATLIWAMRKHDAYFTNNWRTRDGTPVLINLVHDLDLLRHLLGEVTQLAALPGIPLRNAGRIESGAVALAFDSGATATISFADTTPSPWGFEAATGENPNIGTTGQDMLWITGTRGGVSFPSLTQWGGAPDWGTAAQPAKASAHRDTAQPLEHQLTHFCDVIKGTAKPLIDVASARQTLSVALEIEQQLRRKMEEQSCLKS